MLIIYHFNVQNVLKKIPHLLHFCPKEDSSITLLHGLYNKKGLFKSLYKSIVHYIIPHSFPANPKTGHFCSRITSKSIFHKDQHTSMNNVTPVECPSNLKAFNFTLCGKSTSKTSTLFLSKNPNPHKSNSRSTEYISPKSKNVYLIWSKVPSPFYCMRHKPQTFFCELFCSSVVIDRTVQTNKQNKKKGLKSISLFENYFECACVDHKTKADVHSTNNSGGIVSKWCHEWCRSTCGKKEGGFNIIIISCVPTV